MMTVKYLFLIFIIISCTSKKVQKEETITEIFTTSVFNSEKEILDLNKIKSHQVSYYLFDFGGQSVVREFNSKLPFTPASTSKLFTSFYALATLGNKYSFSTKLVYTGKIEKKKLTGNLYLVGGGDPLLFTNDLMNLCLTLKDKIKEVEGDFLIDDTLFETRDEIEKPQDDFESYNPSVTPLSLDFNLFNLHTKFNYQESRVEYFTNPYDSKKKFVLGDNLEYKTPGMCTENEEWTVDKRVRGTHKYVLPHKRGALFAGEQFVQLCQKVGLKLNRPKLGKCIDKCSLAVDYKVHSINEVIAAGLEHSNNLIFENLLMVAAAKEKERMVKNEGEHTPVTFSEASGFLNLFYLKLFNEKNDKTFYLNNGSGLSHDSKVTTKHLTKVLFGWGEKSLPFMPIAGNRGTLVNRLFEPPLSQNIWAKTGTMDGVSTLAGFIFSKSNKPYLFAIMMSEKDNKRSPEDFNFAARRAQDEILKLWYFIY